MSLIILLFSNCLWLFPSPQVFATYSATPTRIYLVISPHPSEISQTIIHSSY